MLQTLAIRGFRAFESYRLTNLARVNLVVGRNNCGKTSVLEAIELLVSGGHPAVFYDSALRRGEMGVPSSRRVRDRPTDVSHVFFGHKFDLGTHFELSSDGGKYTLSVRVRSLDEVGEDSEYWDRRRKQWLQRGLFDQDEEAVPVLGLSIDGGSSGKAGGLARHGRRYRTVRALPSLDTQWGLRNAGSLPDVGLIRSGLHGGNVGHGLGRGPRGRDR